jgi:hypothetical protein
MPAVSGFQNMKSSRWNTSMALVLMLVVSLSGRCQVSYPGQPLSVHVLLTSSFISLLDPAEQWGRCIFVVYIPLASLSASLAFANIRGLWEAWGSGKYSGKVDIIKVAKKCYV